MLVGNILGGIIGFMLMPVLHGLTHSSYNRIGIESICDEMFGKVRLEDALTKEILIIAYEYNTHEPRIFSKFSAKTDPKNYEVSMANASEASSAAPFYFDPKVIGD